MTAAPSEAIRVRLIPLFIALLVATVLVSSFVPGAAGTKTDSIATLDSLTGDSTITDGKVVYVDFWASWCVPCRRSLPWMSRLEGRYRDQGLQVVTINVDRDKAAAHKFLEKMGVSLPVVYDPAGNLAKLYDLKVMPTSFVYGRDGTLRSRNEGFDPEETGSVESFIRTLLEEKAKP